MRTIILLIILGMLYLVSCSGNKEKQNIVVVSVDTIETIMPTEKFNFNKKMKLEKRLNENKIYTGFSDTILSIDYGAFIGQPIGNLINAFGKPNGYFYSGDPYGYLGSCYFEYRDSIQLRIAPEKLMFLKKYNAENNWNMDTFMMEKIRYISIIRGIDVWLYVDD